MPKLLSILNNKKIIFFTILFFVILILPQTIHAQFVPGTSNTPTIGTYNLMPKPQGTEADKCNSQLSFFSAFLADIGDMFMYVPKTIAIIGTSLSDFVTSTVLYWPITNGGAGATSGVGAALAFLAGWKRVRDLANMLIVLGFVVVGIATALRLREYEAKKALPLLIIVALTINFSGLLCGLIVDISNITMSGLLESPVGLMGTTFYSGIEKAEGTILCTAAEQGNLYQYLMTNIMFGFIYLSIAFTFLYLAIVLLARYAILGILFVLSPIAFAMWAFPFPKAKDIWNKWWSEFFKWAFVGVSICFFLNIAAAILETLDTTVNVGTPSGSPALVSLGSTTGYLFVVLMVIVVGIHISSKSSGIGAKAAGIVMGLAAGGAGLAMGAVGAGALAGKLGKAGKIGGAVGDKVGSKTGLKGAGLAVKDTATRAGEMMGLIAPNTTSANQQARVNDKEITNRINSASSEDLVRMATRPGMGHQGRLYQAAAVKKLAAEGQLSAIADAQQRTDAIAQASNFGVRSRDLIGGLQSGEIAAALNNPAAHPHFDNEALANGFKTLSKRGDLDLIQGANRAGAVANAVAHGARIEEIENSDYHYGTQNEARRQRIRNANPTITRDPVTGATIAQRNITEADIDELATQQVLDEKITSMSHEQIRNIDVAHWQGGKGARRVERLTPDKVAALEFAPQASRQAVKSHWRPGGILFQEGYDIETDYIDALNQGDQARATNRYNELRTYTSKRNAANRLPN